MSSFGFQPKVNSVTRICVQVVYSGSDHRKHSGGRGSRTGNGGRYGKRWCIITRQVTTTSNEGHYHCGPSERLCETHPKLSQQRTKKQEYLRINIHP